MSTMKLYLVNQTSEDGDNHDLFVSARDDLEALRLWREHWEIDETYVGGLLIEVPNVSDVPRAHPWHTEVAIKYVENT